MAAKDGKNRSKFVIGLYGVAGLLTGYGAYMVYYTIAYVKDYYSTATTTISDDLASIIQYIVTNCLLYFVYALIIFVGARILKHVLMMQKECTDVHSL